MKMTGIRTGIYSNGNRAKKIFDKTKSAYSEGADAYAHGDSAEVNPYDEGYAPQQFDDWFDGWCDAAREIEE